MKRILSVLVMSVFSLATLAVSAGAASYSIPPQPDWPKSPWEVGKGLNYHCLINQGADSTAFDLRVAVLGTVKSGNTDLYSIEFDITGITGLPADAQEIFIQNYGELPSAIRMKMLVPYYDLVRAAVDPTKFYYDITDPAFIRSLVFQYNRWVPYDVDPALVGGFILPIFASYAIGDELPEDFITERNLGVTFVENPVLYTTENGPSKTAVDAGAFNGWLYTFTSSAEDGKAGSVFYTDKIPILPCILLTGNWNAHSGPATIDMELFSVEPSGAATQILGEPMRLDFQSLMYGMQ